MTLERMQRIISLITGIAAVVVTFTIATKLIGEEVDVNQIQLIIIPVLIGTILLTLAFLVIKVREWSEG